jgi:hypothetical protein
MFAKRVLRRIFGPKREELKGEWRKLLSEEFNWYSSSDIIRVIKSRWIKWAGNVACVGWMRNAHKILV